MQKYNELTQEQRKLVDTHVALTIGRAIGASLEIPAFIGNAAYIEELRNKFSLQYKNLDKTRYDTYLKAKDVGIDINNPQEYINRAVMIVKKMVALKPKQDKAAPARRSSRSAQLLLTKAYPFLAHFLPKLPPP